MEATSGGGAATDESEARGFSRSVWLSLYSEISRFWVVRSCWLTIWTVGVIQEFTMGRMVVLDCWAWPGNGLGQNFIKKINDERIVRACLAPLQAASN
jgi:hypothetical protein